MAKPGTRLEATSHRMAQKGSLLVVGNTGLRHYGGYWRDAGEW